MALIIKMAFTKVVKPTDAFSIGAKPGFKKLAQFGFGTFGVSRFGSTSNVWSKVTKPTDGFTKVAKP